MKIGLIDVDSHNFPNLCLMKLSAYHKAKGHTVEWWNTKERYDLVYKSRVFTDTYSKDTITVTNAEQVIFGGTGYDTKNRLPPEVEHSYPDYSIYPQFFGIAYGFLSRGCPRNCGFCIVSGKEGRKSVKVADLSEFWKWQPEIKIMDANLLACPDHENLIEQLIRSRAWVDFSQGLDIRLVNRDNVSLLNRVRIKAVHFAWDNPDEDLTGYFQRFLDLTAIKSSRQRRVYVLTNYGSTHEQDLYRVNTLRAIYNFREYLLANGSQPSTVNVRVAAIRAYLNYASDMDISVQSVALAISQISPCKTIKKEKPILSDDALAAILSAPPNTKFGVRDRAILILLYDTAVRISELLNIRLCDIAMESKYPNIFITGKGNKERTIQLTAKAVEHLREYILVYHSNSSKEAYLFSTTIKGVTDRMSVGNVQRIIKKYAALVSEKGVSLPDSVHCHMFRRTRATNLYQDGIAIELVSTVLGHARTDTTKSYYAKPSVEQLRDAMESVPTPVSDEAPMWEGNEDEMARLCGLR